MRSGWKGPPAGPGSPRPRGISLGLGKDKTTVPLRLGLVRPGVRVVKGQKCPCKVVVHVHRAHKPPEKGNDCLR